MADVKITDQIIVSVDALSFYSLIDGALMARVNQLTSANLSQGQETVWYEGKMGTRLAGIDRNKTATLTATNGMLDIGTISLQTGSDVDVYDGATKWIEAPYIDELITDDGLTVQTHFAAFSATSGAEIEYIYKLNGTTIVGSEKFEQETTVTATTFKYTVGTKTIELPTGVFAPGDVVVAQYKYKASGTSITSDTEHFSKNAKCIVDITTKDSCSDLLTHSQLEIPRAKVSGVFEISMGDSPTVHNVEVEALASVCIGAPKTLFTYRVVNPVI